MYNIYCRQNLRFTTDVACYNVSRTEHSATQTPTSIHVTALSGRRIIKPTIQECFMPKSIALFFIKTAMNCGHTLVTKYWKNAAYTNIYCFTLQCYPIHAEHNLCSGQPDGAGWYSGDAPNPCSGRTKSRGSTSIRPRQRPSKFTSQPTVWRYTDTESVIK
jgi:hypothetical protein